MKVLFPDRALNMHVCRVDWETSRRPFHSQEMTTTPAWTSMTRKLSRESVRRRRSGMVGFRSFRHQLQLFPCQVENINSKRSFVAIFDVVLTFVLK